MTDPALVRWFCGVHRVLIFAYPAEFRRRYGHEIAQVFRDRCRYVFRTQGPSGMLRLAAEGLADWLIAVFHERIASMQPEMQTARPTGFTPDGIPVFYTCGGEMPRPGALIHGGILAMAAFATVIFLIGQGGSHGRLLIGSHHPSRSHLLRAASTAAPADLTTEVKVKAYPDEPPQPAYFRFLLVLAALDSNRDGIISAAEITHASDAIWRLDANHDGKLTAEECGARLPTSGLAFMQIHPVLAALDSDHNGEISSREIGRAAAVLGTLDRDGSGDLTEDEVRPDAVPVTVIQLMSMLDRNRDGQIDRVERTHPYSQQFQSILDRADRDGDGAVTADELVADLLRLGESRR